MSRETSPSGSAWPSRACDVQGCLERSGVCTAAFVIGVGYIQEEGDMKGSYLLHSLWQVRLGLAPCTCCPFLSWFL